MVAGGGCGGNCGEIGKNPGGRGGGATGLRPAGTTADPQGGTLTAAGADTAPNSNWVTGSFLAAAFGQGGGYSDDTTWGAVGGTHCGGGGGWYGGGYANPAGGGSGFVRGLQSSSLCTAPAQYTFTNGVNVGFGQSGYLLRATQPIQNPDYPEETFEPGLIRITDGTIAISK
jgi:hypothetical protein